MPTLTPGQTFARYRIEALLGQGGMGQVYRGYDTVLRRRVALKVIGSVGQDPLDLSTQESSAKILQEARAAAALNHRDSVSVFDVGEVDGVPFIAMELVEGKTLRAYIGGDPAPIEQRVRWLVSVARALGSAHAAGLVHRDVKPENIMVCPDGTTKVLDFGIAKQTDPAAPPSSHGGPLASPASSRTTEGRVRGTPRYMAPERLEGRPFDGRSDQYSWGLVAYELLSGMNLGLLEARSGSGEDRGLLPPLNEIAPGVVPAVAACVRRAIAEEPAQRYASMDEAANALEACTAPTRVVTLAPPPLAGEALPGETAKTVSDSVTESRATRGQPRWVTLLGVTLVVIAIAALGVAARRRSASQPSRGLPLSSAAPPPTPPARSQPLVLVLAAANETGAPRFDAMDRVLAQALSLSTMLDPVAGRRLRALAEEVDPKGTPDDALWARLARQTGRRAIIVQSSIAPDGAGYVLQATVRDASSRAGLASMRREAPNEVRVVPTIGLLATQIRVALGEAASTEPAAAEKTGMSLSIDADHEYALGRQLDEEGDYVGALAPMTRAVHIDPDFAQAHISLGLALWNSSKRVDAVEQFNLAFKWVDQLTDRARLKFLGDYYSNVGEYDKANAAYRELLDRWPNDGPAAINLASSYSEMHENKTALDLGRRAAEKSPRNITARNNVGVYELLASDLEAAIKDERQLLAEFPDAPRTAYLVIGVASALLGRPDGTRWAYDTLDHIDHEEQAPLEADLALSEGRIRDAARWADQAIRDASGSQNDLVEAQMFAGVVRLRGGDRAGAREMARKVLAVDAMDPRLKYLSGAVCAASGCDQRALAVAGELERSLSANDELLGGLLHAEVLRLQGKPHDAIALFEASVHRVDSWLGHYGLAMSYLDLHAYREAYGEMQTCMARRGEAAGFWLPSLSLVTPFTYYLARAREGIGSSDAQETYRAFLALEPEEQGDPLAADARKRAGGS